jgi:SAM-dependent MidA family methyltransferase
VKKSLIGGAESAGWRAAMAAALYGPGGFFTGSASVPRDHFRTSVHASPLFAEAVTRLLLRVDEALGRPRRLDFVDVGAGRGELAAAVLAALPPHVRGRARVTAVELAARPPDLPDGVDWTPTPPTGTVGLLFANEWLDNVPLDIAAVDDTGAARYVLVDAAGTERLGPPVEGPDAAWLARWWPLAGAPPGTRAEIGRTRDEAWAAAVARVDAGLAVAVDYGHLIGSRPPIGTLTGYRAGRQVPPVPDGSCDLTAHVAFDALAAAPVMPTVDRASPVPSKLFEQREALRALGIDGGRPPRTLASQDPGAYLRALARAGEAAELTDPAGLGGLTWIWHTVRCDF